MTFASSRPKSAEDLVASIAHAILALEAERDAAVAKLDESVAAASAVEQHPFHHRHELAGVCTAAMLGDDHAVPLGGVLASTVADVFTALATSQASPLDLPRLADIGALAVSDPIYAPRGAEQLRRSPFFGKTGMPKAFAAKPQLLLGEAWCAYGLRAGDANALIGIMAATGPAFAARLRTYGRSTLGWSIADILRFDDGRLATRGAAIVHARAERRYREDCASFAAWQAAHPDEVAWRGRPPNSAQGHLTRTTCDEYGQELPRGLSRGASADWLRDANANLRFNRKDESSA